MPTTSIAAGLAVMVGYDRRGRAGEVVEEMREISDSPARAPRLRVPCATPASTIAKCQRGPTSGSWTESSSPWRTALEDAALVLAEKMVEERRRHRDAAQGRRAGPKPSSRG